MTNTINHIKDDAEYVKLTSSTDIKNVQQLYDAMGDWSFKSPGLPIATDTINGIRRLATQQEVDEGLTDNIVTPKTLKIRLAHPQATEDVLGLTKYTKDTEALSFDNTTSVTPKTVKYIFDNYAGTETRYGSAKIASTAQSIAGLLDTVVITPLKLKQALDALPEAPVIGAASESYSGVVQLATTSQVRAGVIREGFAISPYTFDKLVGNETHNGIFKVAKQTDMEGTSDSLVVTPKKLNEYKATDAKFGIVKLTNDINNIDANTALRPNANIFTKDGGIFAGDIYKTTANANNKYLVNSEIDAKITLTKNELITLINDTVDNVISSKLLGVNQTWQQVARVNGRNYVNDTGRPIMLSIRAAAGYSSAQIVVDGVGVSYITDGDKDPSWACVTAIIPNGSTYRAVTKGSPICFELR